MARSLLAGSVLLFCLAAAGARADTTVTVTANSTDCKVSTPAEVVSNSPSFAAGDAAMRNKNYALAQANFRALAQKGDAEGQRAYGQLLMMKCTGLQDQAAAADWLQKAADGGDIPAAAMLGNAYMNAMGVPQDDNKAFGLVTKAATGGNAGAQVDLGYLYLSGRGTPGHGLDGEGGRAGQPHRPFQHRRGLFQGRGAATG